MASSSRTTILSDQLHEVVTKSKRPHPTKLGSLLSSTGTSPTRRLFSTGDFLAILIDNLNDHAEQNPDLGDESLNMRRSCDMAVEERGKCASFVSLFDEAIRLGWPLITRVIARSVNVNTEVEDGMGWLGFRRLR